MYISFYYANETKHIMKETKEFCEGYIIVLIYSGNIDFNKKEYFFIEKHRLYYKFVTQIVILLKKKISQT